VDDLDDERPRIKLTNFAAIAVALIISCTSISWAQQDLDLLAGVLALKWTKLEIGDFSAEKVRFFYLAARKLANLNGRKFTKLAEGEYEARTLRCAIDYPEIPVQYIKDGKTMFDQDIKVEAAMFAFLACLEEVRDK
jgi:hypothetical protein